MSIASQLSDRIKTLEEENSRLKNEILIQQQKLNKLNDNEISKDKELIDQNRKMNIFKKLENLIITIKDIKNSDSNTSLNQSLNKKNCDNKRINDKVKEVIIKFNPQESFKEMYISGDFNNWEPTLMKKSKQVFILNTVLVKDYKYYYIYNNDSEPFILDTDSQYELNKRNNQLNNYIDLCDYNNKENLSNSIFNYQTDFNTLNQLRKDYYSFNMNINYSKVLNCLTQACSISEDYFKREYSNYKLQTSYVLNFKKNDINLIGNKDNEYISRLNNSIRLTNKVFDYLVNRVFKFNNNIYVIKKISIDEGVIKSNLLYDINNLPINNATKYQMNSIINHKLTYLNTKNNEYFNLLSNDESKNIMHEYNTIVDNLKLDDNLLNNKLIIQYKLVNNPLENSVSNLIKNVGLVYYKNINQLKIIKTYVINSISNKEEEISKDDYTLETHNGNIANVYTKDKYLPVFFKGIEIKEPKIEDSLEILTTICLNDMQENVLNIVNIKFTKNENNEFSILNYLKCQNNIKLNIVRLTKNDKTIENSNNNNNNNINNTYNTENYKAYYNSNSLIIFIKNYVIHRIIYFPLENVDKNNKEINILFKEVKIMKDKLVFVKSVDIFPNLGRTLSKIKDIDISNNIRYMNISSCNINNNYCINLIIDKSKDLNLINNINNSYVDLELMIDNNKKYCCQYSYKTLLDNTELLSLNDEVYFSNYIYKEKINENKLNYNEIVVLHKLEQQIINYINLSSNNLLDEEDISKFKSDNFCFIKIIETYLQNNELWEEFERLSFVSSYLNS